MSCDLYFFGRKKENVRRERLGRAFVLTDDLFPELFEDIVRYIFKYENAVAGRRNNEEFCSHIVMDDPAEIIAENERNSEVLARKFKLHCVHTLGDACLLDLGLCKKPAHISVGNGKKRPHGAFPSV